MGMAQAVELKLLLTSVTEAGVARSDRAARRRFERLQAAMAPDVEALDNPETARAEIGPRFLAESAPPEPPRFDELTWPKPQHIADVISAHPELREWAFLVGEEPARLDRFLALCEPPLPHAGAGVPSRSSHRANETLLRLRARVSPPARVGGRATRFATGASTASRSCWADCVKGGSPPVADRVTGHKMG